jgi:hypothetical protein
MDVAGLVGSVVARAHAPSRVAAVGARVRCMVALVGAWRQGVAH